MPVPDEPLKRHFLENAQVEFRADQKAENEFRRPVDTLDTAFSKSLKVHFGPTRKQMSA